MEVVVARKLNIIWDCVGSCGGVELDVFVVGVVDLVGERVVAFGAGGHDVWFNLLGVCVSEGGVIGCVCEVFQLSSAFC